jgi:RES domain-containing protein
MHLWRISNYQDLQGIGGLTKQGRWHTKGKPIVYLAEHPALAMLEVMAHLEVDPEDIPETFKLLTVNVPSIADHCMNLSNELLTKGWNNNTELTQSIGDEWLAKGLSTLLKVPSAIMPSSYNYLLNPLTTNSKDIDIVEVTLFPFDERLLKGSFE